MSISSFQKTFENVCTILTDWDLNQSSSKVISDKNGELYTNKSKLKDWLAQECPILLLESQRPAMISYIQLKPTWLNVSSESKDLD